MSLEDPHVMYNKLINSEPSSLLSKCETNKYKRMCLDVKFWEDYVTYNFEPKDYNFEEWNIYNLQRNGFGTWKQFVEFIVNGQTVPIQTNYPLSIGVYDTEVNILYTDTIRDIFDLCENVAYPTGKNILKMHIFGNLINQEFDNSQKGKLSYIRGSGWAIGVYDIMMRDYNFSDVLPKEKTPIGDLFSNIYSIELYF